MARKSSCSTVLPRKMSHSIIYAIEILPNCSIIRDGFRVGGVGGHQMVHGNAMVLLPTSERRLKARVQEYIQRQNQPRRINTSAARQSTIPTCLF
jgi:hypothetical protein